jgi:hypothetical protein
MNNYTIVDNLFVDPISIRQRALSNKFEKIPGDYPGMRYLIDDESINDFVKNAIITYTNLTEIDNSKLYCMFQLIPAFYERGWVHRDSDCEYAGVVYLNPEPLQNSGTSLYTKTSKFSEVALSQLQKIKNDFYNHRNVSMSHVRKVREFYNSNFTETKNIENKFNRLFMYKANMLHAENNFFGSTKEDSRLTLVFFYGNRKL